MFGVIDIARLCDSLGHFSRYDESLPVVDLLGSFNGPGDLIILAASFNDLVRPPSFVFEGLEDFV